MAEPALSCTPTWDAFAVLSPFGSRGAATGPGTAAQSATNPADLQQTTVAG